MTRILADLHTHTTCSDGILTPVELVSKAKKRGLEALAITDHDSISGIDPAHKAAFAAGITLVPGVELSVQFKERELHLLGYYVDVRHQGLLNYLSYFAERREERARSIVQRLWKMGLPLDFDELRASIPDTAIGRPHIARALVDTGYVKNTGLAFARYLRDGGPADLPKELTTVREALEVVHKAGGLGVLAHPGHWVSDRDIVELKEMGLDGVEIIHPSHDKMLIAFYIKTAEKLSLLQTGGSDYHGKRPGDENNFGKTGLTNEQFERFRLGCGG